MILDKTNSTLITVRLSNAELEALIKISNEECRHVREQARLFIRKQLQISGFLKSEPKEESTKTNYHGENTK